MRRLYKNAKKDIRKRSERLLHAELSASEPGLRGKFARFLCYADMLILDYGIVRILYNNRHRVTPDLWRSAQPTPRHIQWLAKRGVKTIVNLRGEQSFGTRWLEQRACADNGLAYVDLVLKSRKAPKRADFAAIRTLLDKIEYPILVHCKSGADRAGLMSTMARHIREGLPIREALGQLSWRFGHVRSADTGVIDAVFDRYLADQKKTGIEFFDWVETVYDPDEIDRTFKAGKWANRLVNGILRRE